MNALQRYYRIEAHRHGRGGWTTRGPVFPSRIHATAWAEKHGMKPVTQAVNGRRDLVYRLIEVTP